MINRRKFIQQSTLAATSLMALNTFGNSLVMKKQKWGIGLFTIPQLLANDFNGTLKKLSELGYSELEFFGPYSFSDKTTIDRWTGIAQQLGIKQNAFYGFSTVEVKKLLKEYKLTAPSVHLDILTMRTGMVAAMKELSSLGVKYCAIPALMDEPKDTLEHYKRFAEEFNKFGKQMSEYGVTFVYHNHGYEHAEKDGQIPLDYLIQNTDPDKVKFEMDIFWLQAGGANPIDYLKKYPNRFKLMHVKDASEKIRFSGDGGSPDQWMAIFPKMTDPGKGVFDVKGIINAGIASGVDHFFLEYDLTRDPDATLKDSIQYFQSLKV